MDRQVERGTGRQVNNKTWTARARTDGQKEVDRKRGIEVDK